jgi:hypothetical protein
MPVLSYVHQLFNVDQCHAYIHTLRWKDRPLQCPRCQSHDVDPWGTYHYRPGCKRYWCNGCNPTVCLYVASLVASSYGYDDDKSEPTRCALIGAARGDR